MTTMQCVQCGRLNARSLATVCSYCGGTLEEMPDFDRTRAARPVKEQSIESYLVDRVKALGGEVRKVQWVGRQGAPDRLVMLPRARGNTLWVELKRPGGKAKFPKNDHERRQHEEHERMRAMGQRVEVLDSREGVDALLA